ncbi:MAG: hypothetical protein AAF682_01980 [Planctomycetota bacterium]
MTRTKLLAAAAMLGLVAVSLALLRMDASAPRGVADEAPGARGGERLPVAAADLVAAAGPAKKALAVPQAPAGAPATVVEESAPAPAPARRKAPPGPVVLFQHATHDPQFHQGERWELGPGLTDAGLAFPGDDASAVEVPAGLQVTLFEHEAAQGRRLTLGPGRHNLAPYGFNDLATSALVAPFGVDPAAAGPAEVVELYEHAGVLPADRGEVWPLHPVPGRNERLFVPADGAFRPGAASMAWVPQGFELTLFAQPDGRGHALVLGPGLYELEGMDFNDRAASACVRRLD